MNELEEDWSKVTDPAEKRRIQIRNAQRRFRKCFPLRCPVNAGFISLRSSESLAISHT
jgi:hypothetical protein